MLFIEDISKINPLDSFQQDINKSYLNNLESIPFSPSNKGTTPAAYDDFKNSEDSFGFNSPSKHNFQGCKTEKRKKIHKFR